MKRLALLIVSILTIFTAQAIDLTGVKIYINPGHGGYDSNDRSIWTIPVPEVWTSPDGYWESKSNLVKGLALKELLEAAGATVIISRTDNTSGIRDGEQFVGGGDRDLSEIAEEANANNVDHFLSIHSNALNTTTNYLLLLYHGYNDQPTIAQSLPMVQSSGLSQINNPLTVWTSPTPMLRGDFTFYGDNLGLGVLRPLTVPGFLSEGSFHDYPPETHRLMNNDFCRLEAIRFFQHFHNYFKRDMPTTGTIAGFVKSENELVDILNQPKFTYRPGSDDQWLPLNEATVKLLNADGSQVLQTYITDNWYNGIYAFYDLKPGNYKLSFSLENYESKTVDVTVTASEITYSKAFLKNINIIVPDYPAPEQGDGATALSQYDFITDGNIENPAWLNSSSIRRILQRNGKLYVLTTDPKIIVINAETQEIIKELELTGITGGSSILSDIAFSADDVLLACNKITDASATTMFKVYKWENDDAAPTVLFTTQKQANTTNAEIGETFTVAGAISNLYIYYTVKSGANYRIVGLNYKNETKSVTDKYMGADTNYPVSIWGEHVKFTISPSGYDHIIVDSDVMHTTEYKFDWSAVDGAALLKKGELTVTEVPVAAYGNTFARYAGHLFMATPVCNADATKAGIALFDVTNGLSNAVRISDKYPEAGLGTTRAGYLASSIVVNNYDIKIGIWAQGQGAAIYKTEIQPVANIYASELSISPANEFKFTLNEDASSVFITVYKEGETLTSYNAGALNKGAQVITNPFGTTNYDTWSVTASSRPVAYPVKISDDSPIFQFYSGRGVAVDNNPESPFFGRVYVSESAGGLISEGTPVNPRTTQKGIYILDAALSDVTNQGAKSYTGNIAWGANVNASYQYAPRGITTDASGKVYISDSSFGNSGIYIMDAAHPASDFSPLFGGTLNTSNGQVTVDGTFIHDPIEDIKIIGSGTETKLFTYNRPASPVAGGIYRYDIGTAVLPWVSAPSATIYDDMQNGNLLQNSYGQIASDTHGGWWMCQYRAGTGGASVPALIHATNGKLDYNCSSSLPSSYQGAMAVNADGSALAIGTKGGKVEVFNVVYDASNKPTLTAKCSIDWGEATDYLQNMAFDAAGNLYLISNYNERLMVYSLPKSDNTYTTHASVKQSTGITPHYKANLSDCIYISNPVKDEIIINATAGINAESYVLYDTKGIPVRSGIINAAQTKVNVQTLNSGIYALLVKTSEGITNKRILKQ
ncbi:N-acetylmuramoyl-L-alanine amidase [Bacteroides nordii]|uniref:N-acetylmuramoyl-L-alanine amidase n=1 Tax=Bacteroides nordii TaxID=291645 RepID=UPI002A815D84|nr:N-acetylmuramoyl-L-alanine amidase [Bacteroides nordii]